jgi:hypothetical protein
VGSSSAGEGDWPEESQEGPYGQDSETCGRYQNVAGCVHMLSGLVRLSSGNTRTVDWQLGLRGDSGRKPDAAWRRYFTRTQPSFDATREICDPNDEEFRTSFNTPVDRRADRCRGGIMTATLREFPVAFDRYPGCEGAQAGQWAHLLRDGRYGKQSRAQMSYQTTLRAKTPGDDSGGITDQRSDGCIVEMMGKKKWNNSRSWKPMARPPNRGGDVRLHHLSVMKVEPEVDDEVREMRTTKHFVRKARTPQSHESGFLSTPHARATV